MPRFGLFSLTRFLYTKSYHQDFAHLQRTDNLLRSKDNGKANLVKCADYTFWPSLLQIWSISISIHVVNVYPKDI